jgi:hypothetical protein
MPGVSDFLKYGDTSPNWRVVGISATPNASARIAQRLPPAYSIVVQKRDGAVDTLRDQNGRTAIVLDPAPYKAQFEEKERRVTTLKTLAREGSGPTGDKPSYLFGVALPQ